MKCFLVVNQLNDPCYIDYDDPFSDYIISTARGKGLLEDGSTEVEMEANLVMQLFSPLVLSQWLLVDQTKEPCSVVHCPNGFCFVFHHVDDLLFICINGDGTESEDFLHKKIQVFISMIRFMFGPVTDIMVPSYGYTKRAKLDFLRKIMHTWADLAESEQSFLVEAVERMHVNQVMNEKCVEILKKSIKHIQAARDSTTQHGLLLAKSKLLALYSNRSANELLAKDLLSLMVLSKTLYPSANVLEDLFSKNYTGLRDSTPTNEILDWGDEEYHSAPNTPKEGSPTPGQMFDDRRTSVSTVTRESPTSYFAQSSGSFSAKSTQEVESAKNEEKSDIQGGAFLASQESVPTLLQMYKEKYPDSEFNLSGGVFESLAGGSSLISQGATADVIPSYESKSAALDYDTTETIQSTMANNNGLVSVDEVVANKNSVDHDITASSEGKEQEDHINTKNLPVEIPNQKEIAEYERSKSPSLLQNISPGGSSLMTVDEASRSSSVLSNVSAAYPALSPQIEDYRSIPTSPDLDTSDHREITPTPRYQLRKDASVGTSIDQSKVFITSPNNAVTPTEQPVYSHRLNRTPPTPSSTQEPHHHSGSDSASTSAPTESSIQTTVSTVFGSHTSMDMYIPQTVFLETSTCPYSPYCVDALQVLPGVTLVLLSELPNRHLADNLCQVIHNIQDLLYGRRIKLNRSRSQTVYDIISSLLSKLHSSLKKFKGRIRSLITDINSRWEKENWKMKLLDYLERDDRVPIPPELESAMTELYKKLKELFSHMFLTPVSYSSHVYEALTQLKAVINAELMDYSGYLSVKVERNITMTSYIDDFPGLIHFIFVDRHFHQMTAPSFNISLKEGESMDATSYLKKKVWTMQQHMMIKLMEGYTTVMIKDGDFYFSYFLWFEEYTGTPLPVQESLKQTRRRAPPGILSSSFYKDLLRQCFPHAIKGSVHCFEMFLMHLGTVHPQFISSQCKKLAHKMWEMSGETYSGISLF